MSEQEAWLVGLNAVQSALEHDESHVIEVLVDRERSDRRVRELLDAADRAGVSIRRVDRQEMQKRFARDRHQGVAARYRAPGYRELSSLLEEIDGQDALVLVLDHLEDPRNFGACLRTAEAAGAAAVVFPKDRAVGLTPSARKAASGAAERLPLVQVTNLSRAIQQMKDAGFWVAGADGDAEQLPWDCDLTGRTVLVLGSEGKGLHRLVREHCDFLLRIPMAGAAESLNVSVAAAILLYEAVRQRQG